MRGNSFVLKRRYNGLISISLFILLQSWQIYYCQAGKHRIQSIKTEVYITNEMNKYDMKNIVKPIGRRTTNLIRGSRRTKKNILSNMKRNTIPKSERSNHNKKKAKSNIDCEEQQEKSAYRKKDLEYYDEKDYDNDEADDRNYDDVLVEPIVFTSKSKDNDNPTPSPPPVTPSPRPPSPTNPPTDPTPSDPPMNGGNDNDTIDDVAISFSFCKCGITSVGGNAPGATLLIDVEADSVIAGGLDGRDDIEISIAGACTVIDPSINDTENALASCTLTIVVMDEPTDFFARVVATGTINHELFLGIVTVTGIGGDFLNANLATGEMLLASSGEVGGDDALALLRLS